MTLTAAACSRAAKAGVVTLPEAEPSVTLDVEIADSPIKWIRGLSKRETLPDGSGMFFVFEEDGLRTFWMKDVHFPIDIIFIDGDMVIKKIWKSVPPCEKEPCELYPSGGPVRYALETHAGFCDKYGVKVGQKVEFKR